jgi:hypothetical protein
LTKFFLKRPFLPARRPFLCVKRPFLRVKRQHTKKSIRIESLLELLGHVHLWTAINIRDKGNIRDKDNIHDKSDTRDKFDQATSQQIRQRQHPRLFPPFFWGIFLAAPDGT